MSGRVVIGFDGTDSGEDALTLGAHWHARPATLPVVVTVYPEENPIGVGRVDAEWVAYMREQASEVQRRRRARFLEARGVEAEYRVVGSSSAAHGLDDVAEAEGASMIVVGSARRGARRRILPGSTGERLLHGASARSRSRRAGMHERPTDAPMQRIGVAYVDTPEGREALRFAARLAQRTGARADALHGRRAAGGGLRAGDRPRRRGGLPGQRCARTRARRSTRRWPRCPDDVEATDELLEGDVVDELAALDERDVDLLVCGSRGYGPVRRVLLGGVSRQLDPARRGPVVVVPRTDA